jgi:hypothetical protein
MTEESAADATTLRTELESATAGEADIPGAIAAIDNVFDCP